MTVEQLAAELERAYWANDAQRVACGDAAKPDEIVAANAHLPMLAKHTARAGARWAQRAHRPGRFQPAFVADTVAHETKRLVEQAPECKMLLSTIGFLLLRSLLENLAWRFAVWLFSDATSDDRPELLCRMEVT